MPNYIITLKWGNRYAPEYVNRLASTVRRLVATLLVRSTGPSKLA
jgi:hypothetical protein